MPQGGARCQNLGHLNFFFIYRIIRVLFRTDNICMTSDFRVHALPGMGLEVKIQDTFKVLFYFILTNADILPNIYYKEFILGQLVPYIVGFDSMASDSWSICTIHCRLSLDSFRHLGLLGAS